MKLAIFFSILQLGFFSFAYAQSGPGGVGNSNNNILWLDATQISGATDSMPISSWNDVSGNNNHAIQNNAFNSPIFISDRINGHPSLIFDGVDDFFELQSNITSGAISIFAVYLNSKISNGNLVTLNKHVIYTENNRIAARYLNPNNRYRTIVNTNNFFVASIHTDSNINSGPLLMSNGYYTSSFTRSSLQNNTTSYVGKYDNLFLQGVLSEIVIYNEFLNSAQRKIISNYLAAKYNLVGEQNLYSFKTSYNHGVKGIGQEADGNQLYARGQDSLAISNASSMDDGDYVLVGHNNAGYSTTTATGPRAVNRWEQVWRMDKTGDPGTVDMEFFLGSNGFTSTSNYIILIETADGDFTNGGTSIHEYGRQYNSTNNSIIFTEVDLPDGAYFTLAEKNAPISSTNDGNWDNPESWNCGCIPDVDDVVINQNNLTISSNKTVLDITITNGGSLSFSGSDTLFIQGTFDIQGSINTGTGTIAAVNQSIKQVFMNNSASAVDFYNLYVNNHAGLDLVNGSWGIINNLQVSSGGLDVTQSNNVTLFSDANRTAQILPSMNSAFTGDFILQRYIGPRNAGWADLSSPVENATVADWDDDLYISGINGNDGNVELGNGSIYYTMFTYDYQNDVHVPITSTSTPLKPAKGYELWLADNSSSFFGKTIDLIGAPNNGSYTIGVDQGWNFVGNPYQSFIAYDSITKSSWIPDNYYIWNTHNGSYDFFNGSGKPPIAPGQGFWIHKIPGGHKFMEFTENVKINSNSSTFLREKTYQDFGLNISSSTVPYSHKMELGFSIYSSEKFDEMADAYYLKSKLEEAPAITTKASDSEKELIYSSLNPLETTQHVPISIYAGVVGQYHIQAENLHALGEHYNYALLVDKEENTSMDLFAKPKYTFESNKGSSDRFELILSNSPEVYQNLMRKSGVARELNSTFSLRNSYDQWYVDYHLNGRESQVEVQVFNMNGQKVRNPETFKVNGSGTYLLQNLKGLNGLYLIQVKSDNAFINKLINL